MASSLADLPQITDFHEFNQSCWNELNADPALASLAFRVETDRFGHILMSPPPSFEHSDRQGKILEKLKSLIQHPGRARPEVPLSTSQGVKAIDAAWISEERLSRARQGQLLAIAPEICVEVLSPSNTREEIEEKKRLYFEAGADEVWILTVPGQMLFYRKDSPETTSQSAACPSFPATLP